MKSPSASCCCRPPRFLEVSPGNFIRDTQIYGLKVLRQENGEVASVSVFYENGTLFDYARLDQEADWKPILDWAALQ